MIGLVLVAHGGLAEELLLATEHVVGHQKMTCSICIGPEDNMEIRRKEISEAVKNVDDGDGVIILTDMFGGTPSNLAISIMSQFKVEVVAGMNLPMLIKLASVRNTHDIESAANSAQESGRKYINSARKLLEGDES